MPTDPQPLSAAERDAIQDVLAVGGSPQAQALRRYEATLRMLDVEYADIIRTQRAQIAALEAERDAQAVRLAAAEAAIAQLAGDLSCADRSGQWVGRGMGDALIANQDLRAKLEHQAARLAAVEQAIADNQWLKESHGVTRANDLRPRGYCTGCHDKHPCDVISLLEDLEAALKGAPDA